MGGALVPPSFNGGNMSNTKKIACRVCGSLFEPCAYCQAHADVFRWRNFACSIKCATKYINDTIAYRESLHNSKQDALVEPVVPIEVDSQEQVLESEVTTKKTKKKMATVIGAENEI